MRAQWRVATELTARRLAVQADARGGEEAGGLLRADQRLGEEALHHDAPDVLPAGAEGPLEEDGLGPRRPCTQTPGDRSEAPQRDARAKNTSSLMLR